MKVIFINPKNGDRREVEMTSVQIQEKLAEVDVLYDLLNEEVCVCPRGESEYDEGCNCLDYAEEFVLQERIHLEKNEPQD